MKLVRCSLYILLIIYAMACQGQSQHINPKGKTVSERFLLPDGYQRLVHPPHSFAHYLQSLPLRPDGAKVHYHNGEIKSKDVYDGVVDMELGKQNLQQCADAVIRLRAEYLYKNKQYESISFNFTNGFKADYSKWMQGYRVGIDGNRTWWKQSAKASNTYDSFRKYLDIVFSYAGTLSLAKSLKKKAIKDITVGDVFVIGGSPGHAVIVVDMAEKDGEKIMLLAQSYMPAQDTQILKNKQDRALSPWYKVSNRGELETAEWTFDWTDLKGF